MKYFILTSLIILLASGCSENNKNTNTAISQTTNSSHTPGEDQQTPVEDEKLPTKEMQDPAQKPALQNAIDAAVDEIPVTIQWEDNESVRTLHKSVKNAPVTIKLEAYGGFEQVGPIGTDLPRNDVQTTTAPGDIVLYSGDQIVIFYGSNSWSYTRLGRITGKTDEELRALLDKDSVTFQLSARSESEAVTADISEKKQLAAYFSVTKHTKSIAEYISEHTGAVLYEIVPETPYTKNDINYGDDSSRTSIEQNDPHARPRIASAVENIEQYDIIYLGYPIWWGEAPKILYTFLESASIKSTAAIVPFCTSASSPIGSSAENMKSSASSQNWLEGRRFSIGTDKSTVTEWVDSLNLN